MKISAGLGDLMIMVIGVMMATKATEFGVKGKNCNMIGTGIFKFGLRYEWGEVMNVINFHYEFILKWSVKIWLFLYRS